MLGFVIRLIGYALMLGFTARLADALWIRDGLDRVGALQSFHDHGTLLLYVAAVVLALAGFGRWRGLALFAGFFLAGAALTAPFAIARVAFG